MLKVIGYVFIILAGGTELHEREFVTMQECKQWVLQQQFVPAIPYHRDEVARGMWCEEETEV